MPFLDKLFRWKKKPFGKDSKEEAKKTDENISKSSGNFSDKGSGAFAHILVRPHISEKAIQGEALGQYVFEVVPAATKHDVAIAVKDLYGVMPTRVRMVTLGGKQLRFGATQGATKHWKKAIIQLPKGKTIEVYKK